MRILYYNWVDYLDDEFRGGGVSVYQYNLLRALDDMPDVAADFISAGLSYDLRGSRPRWERLRHGREPERVRYEIINSGALSPAHHSFGNEAQITHPGTEQAFFDFIRAKGPFDVIHFNNLEGIPAQILTLKEHFPDTKVILSLHNYFPFCPQVNLWFEETENCSGFAQGAKCVDCLPHKPPENLVRLANALAYKLKSRGIKPGTRRFDLAFRSAIKTGSLSSRLLSRFRKSRPALPHVSVQERAAMFANRRSEMVRLINTSCDRVLCVSDRVREIAAHHGIRPDILQTSYIGTAHAQKFAETKPRKSVLRDDGTVTLGYLGYMRRDKGFFFLLDALEKLPDELVSRVRLLAAAREGPLGAMARLEALRGRMAEVIHVNGYGHDQLDGLMEQVDVGLIPVLWQDNLPQVAIEMHARHIPLLTSDLGGAQELAACPDMVFKAGDIESFGERLRFILDGGLDIDSYWATAMSPVSMPGHIADLMAVYGGKAALTGPESPAAVDEAEIDRPESEFTASQSSGR